MDNEIRINDVVALLEDTATQHFETGRSLLLRRGQIGTIVMTYDGRTFEVEFSSRDGHSYALLPIEGSKLMLLRDSPESAVA